MVHHGDGKNPQVISIAQGHIAQEQVNFVKFPSHYTQLYNSTGPSIHVDAMRTIHAFARRYAILLFPPPQTSTAAARGESCLSNHA